ncbi:MAG TPA: carboxypeptidase-like regulatory domain-containing protein [Bacteroidales bacterium]|nr:carboxypeptidase-like regulatory domain-containing protein [Bacteroidales bacterium]HRZ49906.1 carboxypeptidase-like regulatory domain-containing protein [Bacteroidales bacterium]
MKNYTPLLLLFIPGFLFFAGCNKNSDRILIEGTVTDVMVAAPVEGVTVNLVGKMFEGGVFNPNPSLIATVQTDASGKFRIDIAQVKASDFELQTVKDRYFDYSKPLTINEISSGKAYNPQISLNPIGALRLQVQNTNPVNASDLITFRIVSDNPSCSGCCNSNWQQGTGMGYDTLAECRTKAGKTAVISWNIHKGTNHKTDSALVNIPRFDTAFYHLVY